MSKFGIKSNITDKDFMIHIFNNLPEEHDEILDSLENCLMPTGTDVLLIEVIHEKLNHWYEKLKTKVREERKRMSIGSLWQTIQE